MSPPPEIKVVPPEATGTLTKLSGQFSTAGGAMAPQSPPNLDPRIDTAVGAQSTSSQQALTGASDSAQRGRTGVDALEDQDRANGRKAGGVDADPKDRPGGSNRGDAPRLSPADIEKLKGAGQYQSAMPTMQTAPPSMPQMPPMPTQGMSAPTQAMMGAPGAISPMLGQILSAAAQNPSGDGGPPSERMGSALPGQGGKLQDIVRSTLGIPYAWGGGALDGPSKGISDGGGPADRAGDYNKVGFDCSGLARYIHYQMTGQEVARTSESQYATGMAISASQARPGDFFFPDSAGRPPGHVQVYIGNNQVVEAPSSGQTVKISALRPGEFRRMGE